MLSFSSHGRFGISTPSDVKSFLRPPLITSFRFFLPFRCLYLENNNGRKKWNSRLHVVQAKKGKTRVEKFDDHNFIPKQDEATGPFPEALLLKKVFFFFSLSLLSEFSMNKMSLC